MKNTIKITTAIFFFVFLFLTQTNAQSKQSDSSFSITIEGDWDLDFAGGISINLYNGLTKQLKKDGLIKSEDDYHFILENDGIRVDGKRLKGRDLHKFQDMIRDDFEDIRLFEIKWKDGSLATLKIKTDE